MTAKQEQDLKDKLTLEHNKSASSCATCSDKEESHHSKKSNEKTILDVFEQTTQ